MSELILENKSDLPNGWEEIEFNEIITKIPLTGKKLKQKEYQEKGKLSVIDQGRDFIGGYSDKIKLKVNCHLPVIVFGDHTKNIKFVEQEFIAGADGVKVLEPIQPINPKLIYYFIQAIPIPNKGYARHYQYLEKSFIRIPPLNEQKRIVEKIEEFFSNTNYLRKFLQKNLRSIEFLKNSILQDALTGKLVSQNPNEPPLNIIPIVQKKSTGRKASTDVKMGKVALSVGNPESKLDKGWQWIPLLQVAELATGHTPKRKNSEYWNGKIPWVTGEDAGKNDGNYIFETNERITKLGVDNSAAVILPKETVCLAREASIGYCVLLGKPMATNQRFANFMCGANLLPKFLMYLFLFERNYMFQFKEGSIFGTIYFPAVKSFHVSLPPIEEQKRIVEKIDFIWSLIIKMKRELTLQLNILDSFERSVLRHAFEGKLVPQDPNDEPAEILLQKIKLEKEQLKQKEKSKKRKKNGR